MSLHDDLNNENLFDENQPGDYEYSENQYGKTAKGQLTLENGQRNAYAQRTVGGNDRLATDDGGHLIATRFNGSGEKENMEAQDANLNRGSYKIHENELADQLSSGNKVYENVETFKSNGSQRPDAYMGYTISEDQNGNRQWDAFSYTNASASEQQEWNDLTENNDLMDEYDNAMDYPDDYNPGDYESNDYDSGDYDGGNDNDSGSEMD